MNILIVGSGGREHAIAWSVAKSPLAEKIYCAPGNAGIAQIAECVPIGAMEFDRLADFAEEKTIGLTIIGSQTAPEGYEGYTGLYNGIYDEKRNITLEGDVSISGASNNGIELTTGTVDVGNLTITDAGKRGVNIYGDGKLYAKSLHIENTFENGIKQRSIG